LNPGRQALLVLVYLSKGETFDQLGAGFGVSTATAWRCVEETVMLLSARSPKLGEALRKARRDGPRYLVLDGTPIRTDRVKADRPFFSGKHRVHGMNVGVIASPDGTILWTSGALPGRTHDLSAARIWGILRALEKAGIIVLADKGYQGGEGPVITPYKGKDKPESQNRANRSHARLRGPDERANSQLKSWRILRKLRCCPLRPDTCARPSPCCRTTQPHKDEKGSVKRISTNCRYCLS
jgi:DDE superfamily endonuclease/Helix-turn-helix of DDE superfamily endonuclease